MLDHLPDRESLALVSRSVARQEPGETIVWIVGRLLLGIDDRKAESVGELRPAAAAIVLRGTLAASVQRHDQRRIARQTLGLIAANGSASLHPAPACLLRWAVMLA